MQDSGKKHAHRAGEGAAVSFRNLPSPGEKDYHQVCAERDALRTERNELFKRYRAVVDRYQNERANRIRLCAAMKQITDVDYLGNRHESATIASAALAQVKS